MDNLNNPKNKDQQIIKANSMEKSFMFLSFKMENKTLY